MANSLRAFSQESAKVCARGIAGQIKSATGTEKAAKKVKPATEQILLALLLILLRVSLRASVSQCPLLRFIVAACLLQFQLAVGETEMR